MQYQRSQSAQFVLELHGEGFVRVGIADEDLPLLGDVPQLGGRRLVLAQVECRLGVLVQDVERRSMPDQVLCHVMWPSFVAVCRGVYCSHFERLVCSEVQQFFHALQVVVHHRHVERGVPLLFWQFGMPQP